MICGQSNEITELVLMKQKDTAAIEPEQVVLHTTLGEKNSGLTMSIHGTFHHENIPIC